LSTQQIYNEAARIYALNRDRFGEDPNLIYPGEVLSVATAPKPGADPAGSGRPGRDAGPALSERAPKKAAAADPSPSTLGRPAQELPKPLRTPPPKPEARPTKGGR
jgi:hypothetical protein